MAATVQAFGAKAEGVGSVSPANPTHQANDLLLAVKEQAETGTYTVPGGSWAHTPESPRPQGSNVTQIGCVWLRATGAGTADPSFGDPGNHQVAASLVIRGALATGDPFDTSSNNGGASGSMSSTGLAGPTTTVADCLIVWIISSSLDSTADEFTSITHDGTAGVSGFAVVDQWFTDQGNGGGFVVCTATRATAGASGTVTATLSGGSWSGIAFAIEPAASDTDASAENSPATGAANTPTPSVKPTGGAVAATGTAEQPAPSVKPTAGDTTATAAAQQPAAGVAPTSATATATAAALDATISTATATNAAAECATATGAAGAPSTAVSPAAGEAAATGAAAQPSASVAATAETAAATGTAEQPTIQTGATANAAAEAAAATGTAHPATPSVSPTGGSAEATGTAAQPAISVSVRAECATAGGAASAPAGGVSVVPGSAAATAASLATAAHVQASAALAEALAAAEDGDGSSATAPNGQIGELSPVAAGQVVNPAGGEAVGGVITAGGTSGAVISSAARAAVGTMYQRADRDPIDPEVSEYV